MIETNKVSLTQIPPFPAATYTIQTDSTAGTGSVSCDGMGFYELPDIQVTEVPLPFLNDALRYVQLICRISDKTFPKKSFLTRTGLMTFQAFFEPGSKYPASQYGRYLLKPI